MNTNLCRCSALLFLLLTTIAGHAESACTDALQKELINNSYFVFNDWQDVYKAYQKYAVCDSGSYAEDFSDKIVKLLMNHWDKFDGLYSLSVAHKDFEKFVLSHIDETMSLDDLNSILDAAKNKCPQYGHNLCDAIIQRGNELEVEVKRENQANK